MPLFTNNIGIVAASSGSEFTQSFDVFNVFVASPTYGISTTSASIASIKASEIQYNDSGSAGELVFLLNSFENSGSVGDPVLTLSATGSNSEPRVGIGFSGSEKPIKAFEIKTKTDSAEGSEFLIRSSRLTEGAQVGDLGGAIRFSIDSASFKDVTTSGSVALIDSIVTTVESEGVTGDLAFNVATSTRLAPTEMVRLRGDGNRVDITGSLRTTNGTRLGTSTFNTHTLTGSVNIHGDLDISGDITVTGTVDGVDVSTLNISGAGDFVNNEFIVAVGTNAVTSSDALAVDSAGNLGIGISTPEVRLHMRGESAQTAQFLMEQYNDTADAPDIRTRRFRGTPAAPADVQTGDYLFRINVEGRDDGSNATYGSMQFDVDGTDQDALNWRIQTRDTGGTLADRITIDSAGDTIVAGEVSSNTIKNIETTLASDSATNVDTFATATYKGAIYDYVLYDAGVGARTGQFMVIQDNSNIDFTDNSTPTIGSEATIPSITAVINGSNVEVKVTNGNGYTFKAIAKKL